uniref:SCAN box domain-containing protein n=1 Tax=Scleropages formosus TaxID=113540 RepID=A0A8C9T6F7_SCLFO
MNCIFRFQVYILNRKTACSPMYLWVKGHAQRSQAIQNKTSHKIQTQTTRSLPHFYLNPETYRQQFRSMETKDILEVVVLQQYLRTLYPEGKIWVQEHRPAMAAEAAELVENYVAAQKSSKTHRYAGQLDCPTYLVPFCPGSPFPPSFFSPR